MNDFNARCRTSVAEISLSKGDLLYCRGSLPECAYIVEFGELVLFETVNGKRVEIERRGPGAVVGEQAILLDAPRAVSAEALEDCRVHRISSAEIIHRFEKLDSILRACIETSLRFVKRPDPTEIDDSYSAPMAPVTLNNPQDLIEQFKFERDIQRGIEAQQFSLAYQPIVNLSDGYIFGFEALMRWQHPTKGNIPPIVFIQAAERMGSICSLTDFALIESCAALKRFHRQVPERTDLFASVNVSGVDIDREGFVDFIAHVLDLNDLKPHHLKLEVTETAIVPDSSVAAKTLMQLKEFGCGLSIDDFGTGYSNLAYLKELPVTALKIDRAFAGDAYKNAVSRSIVKMMVGLGHELGVEVIAEGLESRKDVDTLLDLGCDMAQGYYFSKPICETDFSAIFAPDQMLQSKIA